MSSVSIRSPGNSSQMFPAVRVKTLAGGLATLAARFGATDVAAGDCRKRRCSCKRGGQCCNAKKTACREFPAGSAHRCPGVAAAAWKEHRATMTGQESL